jgi:hypothetical protein
MRRLVHSSGSQSLLGSTPRSLGLTGLANKRSGSLEDAYEA